MWSLSKQALEMPDVDPLLLAVPQQLLLFDADRQVFESPKKEKMSTVIDQQDETEVTTLSRSQVDINFQNHVVTAGAEPLQEAEQIAAVEEK